MSILGCFARNGSTRTDLDAAARAAGRPCTPSIGSAVTSPSPRSRAFAGRRPPVTERSEGNPRSGLTGGRRSAAVAAKWGWGSHTTAPELELRLRFHNAGYVLDARTGEVLSSVVADVKRDRARARLRIPKR
jgi:hypothetical protein